MISRRLDWLNERCFLGRIQFDYDLEGFAGAPEILWNRFHGLDLRTAIDEAVTKSQQEIKVKVSTPRVTDRTDGDRD